MIRKTIGAAALALLATTASFSTLGQTIKIGFITSYSGLNGNLGPYMERAVRLYIKQHEKELPPGVKIELITRDDTGPNPDKAKQLAQELIVRDKVNLLAGVIFTPNAMAIAPLATEAKVPFVIMNAGTAVITTRSPYIARTSFTLWQSSFPLGTWAAKKYKTAYTLVSDFGPGHDAETAFTQAFKAGGGNVVANVRVPLQNPDLAAYMQRVKDAKPDALMVFIPAGKTATAVMKNFSDLGLDKRRHQADRAGRHHHRGRAAEHGRRGARRHHRVPLVRGRRPSGEQGVRRGVEEGVRRERDAELPLGRLVGRHRADLRRHQAAEGQARPGPHHGDLQGAQERQQPARPDLDRPRDARHHPAGVPARGAQGRRPAR